MAEIADIIKKTTEILNANLGLTVLDKDIEENLPRPCCVVDTDDINIEPIGLMEHIYFTLHIYYFAPDRYSGFADLYAVGDRLKDAFKGPLHVNDTFIFTLENKKITTYRSDMAVELSGTVDIVNGFVDEETEEKDLMLELDVELEKREGD